MADSDDALDAVPVATAKIPPKSDSTNSLQAVEPPPIPAAPSLPTKPTVASSTSQLPPETNAPWFGDKRAQQLVHSLSLSPEAAQIRQQVVSGFVAAGYPPQAAEGFADWIQGESNFDPAAWNPDDKGSPSGGLPQFHGSRLDSLMQFAAQQNKPPTDPGVQISRMIAEFNGADPIAAAHKNEFMNPNITREDAKAGFGKYFARAAGAGSSQDLTGFYNDLASIEKNYGASAKNALAEALKAAPGSEERIKSLNDAIEHSKKMREEFEDKIKKPPRPTSDFEAMQEWSPLMIGLFALAGSMTKRPAIGAINAASSALDGLHKGNQEQYKLATDMWKTQNELALKAFGLENDEIANIIKLEDISETERQARMRTTLAILGIDRSVAKEIVSGKIAQGEYLDKRRKLESDLENNISRRKLQEAQTKWYKERAEGGGMTRAQELNTAKSVYAAQFPKNLLGKPATLDDKAAPPFDEWLKNTWPSIRDRKAGEEVKEITMSVPPQAKDSPDGTPVTQNSTGLRWIKRGDKLVLEAPNTSNYTMNEQPPIPVTPSASEEEDDVARSQMAY